MNTLSPYELLSEEERITMTAISYVVRKIGSTNLHKLNNKNLSKEERHTIFIEVYDLASQKVAKKSYGELSPLLRSCISSRHGLASDFRFQKPPDTAGPSLREEIEEEIKEENRQAILEDWFRALLNSKDPQHALHPEDDAVTMENLDRYAQNDSAFGPFLRSKKHR